MRTKDKVLSDIKAYVLAHNTKWNEGCPLKHISRLFNKTLGKYDLTAREACELIPEIISTLSYNGATTLYSKDLWDRIIPEQREHLNKHGDLKAFEAPIKRPMTYAEYKALNPLPEELVNEVKADSGG